MAKVHTFMNTKILEGLIFTDGHIGSKDNQFVLGTPKYEYAVGVQQLLIKDSGASNVRLYDTVNSLNGKKFRKYMVSWHNKSLLKSFRYLWYPEGKKRIPDNFILTSDFLNISYIADGTVVAGAPAFCMGWIENLEKFESELKRINLDFVTRKTASGYQIRLATSSNKTFFDYIGSPLISCFKYKWTSCVENAREVFQTIGWTDKEVSILLGGVHKNLMFMWEKASDYILLGCRFNYPISYNVDELNRIFPKVKQINSHYECVLYGRGAKKALEVIFDFLPQDLKFQSTLLLAFPLGKRKQDLKHKLLHQFKNIVTSNTPAETERKLSHKFNNGMKQQSELYGNI